MNKHTRRTRHAEHAARVAQPRNHYQRHAELRAAVAAELARLVRDQRDDDRLGFSTRRPLPDDGERGARFDGIDDGDSEYGALEAHPFFM